MPDASKRSFEDAVLRKFFEEDNEVNLQKKIEIVYNRL